MPDRSPEERERARLEREARRAGGGTKRSGWRRGRPAPEPAPGLPEPASEPPADVEPPRYAPMPGTTSNSPAEPPAEAPPATGRQWGRAAGDPDPDPPLVRRVPRGSPRESVQPDEAPVPEPAQTAAPAPRIPPAPPLNLDGSEQAIGTRRVPAGHRIGRPHLPHRRPKGSSPPRSPGEPGDRRVLGRRVGAVVALAAVAFVLWFGFSLFQPFAGDGSGAITVTIPKGASVGEVGDLLASKNVVSSSFFFGLRARLEGKDSELNSGPIALKRDMSYGAALDALTRSKAAPVARLGKLTIPEGLSRTEIAPRAKQAGLSGDYVTASRRSGELDPRKFGAPKGATMEGFLFPATYQFRAGAPVRNLISQQLRAFRQNIATVDLRRAKRKHLSTYDVLVIASMVDREAGIAKDRPLIAAVIYNRLKQGMVLGIDATLRYELGNWDKPLKVSELNRDTPYNTRRRAGLPPTPIGNPGLASIEAAAHPAKVDYLFYVVRPCGNGAHNFSATDAEFQHDVDAYNAKRAELGGKSPVTCR